MSTGWLIVKKGTFAGYPVFEVRKENDNSNVLTMNELVARQLYRELGEALGVDDCYSEGWEDGEHHGYQQAQENAADWYTH